MRSSNDEILLRLYARSGDEAAFRELARRYGGLVYAACLREVRRPDLAEDAAQAVFLDLARKAGRVRVGGSLVPWLYAASKHAGRNVLRAERRRPTVPLEDTLPAAPTDLPDDALFQALDALNSSDREAVVLRFVQGLSFAEVGQAQGVSEDAARMRVGRALKRLRTEYVPAFAPTAHLAARLATLPLPAPVTLMTTPLLLSALGGVAVLAGTTVLWPVIAFSISQRIPQNVSAPATPPAPPLPPKFTDKEKTGVSPSRPIDKPFTLTYHYAERDLRTQTMREAEAKETRKRLTPYVDQDKMTPEDLENSVASALRLGLAIERDVTLSFDGTTLYIDCQGGSEPATFLVRKDRTYEFPADASRKRHPGFHDSYWLFIIPLPMIGPSLPYVPLVRGDGRILVPNGAPGADGKPWYNPGRIETKAGKVMRIVQNAPGVKQPYGTTTFSDHRDVNGFAVAGSAVYREGSSKDPRKTRTFTLTSASDGPLPSDRFVPESYLPEKTDFGVTYQRRGSSFPYERVKGPLDDQIAAFIAAGGR